MQEAIRPAQQHTVAFQGRNPSPTFLTKGGEVLAAAGMHQTKASVLIVDDDLITVQPTNQATHRSSNCAGSTTALFREQVKVPLAP